jgi:CheY-like chemotaxis protein
MKILIAEDESGILEVYKIVLEDRGHEVTVATDGDKCIKAYDEASSLLAKNTSYDDEYLQSHPPFDVVILDYRMPRKDGMEAAKHIIDQNPHQRIIFASAYVKETLVDSVKQLHRVVELLQKPFEMQVFVEIVEDKAVYEELQKIEVKIELLREQNVTHDQLVDLLAGLKNLLKKNNPLLDCLKQ